MGVGAKGWVRRVETSSKKKEEKNKEKPTEGNNSVGMLTRGPRGRWEREGGSGGKW